MRRSGVLRLLRLSISRVHTDGRWQEVPHLHHLPAAQEQHVHLQPIRAFSVGWQPNLPGAAFLILAAQALRPSKCRPQLCSIACAGKRQPLAHDRPRTVLPVCDAPHAMRVVYLLLTNAGHEVRPTNLCMRSPRRENGESTASDRADQTFNRLPRRRRTRLETMNRAMS
jgi:hypothetical protein